MKIYTCQDRLTDIMTCIYDAWSEALRIGHDQIQLKKEPILQQTMFDEYVHVILPKQKRLYAPFGEASLKLHT